VEQRWISLTPLRLDLTDEDALRVLRAHRPLDEAVAVAFSPPTSSPAAAKSVREDEAPHSIAKTVDADMEGAHDSQAHHG
jgi:hypothetical protein